MKKSLLGAVSALAMIAGANLAQAADTIKIGIMATLEGTYTVLGEDGVRGVKTALAAYGKVAGKDVELSIQSTDTTPDSAVRAARKLVEQDGLDVIVGPLSGSEGIAIRDYSKTQPQATFINGSSGAQETTFVNPSENFFRYNADGAQWSWGLGKYVHDVKGYKSVATIGEDYSFVYTQVLGFALDFCQAGGEITERLWVPLGTKDFGSIIASLPDDVDAIYLGLGGGDAVNFLNQYQQAGGDANLIGGTIMVDGTVLNSKGDAKRALIGTPSSGPQADTWGDPKWQEFVKLYQDTFPEDERFPAPSLLATLYYNNTMATLTCLDEVGNDLSDGHGKFRQCLANIELDSPVGKVTLDNNRQAVAATFISEVIEADDGNLKNEFISVTEAVPQHLGMGEEAYRALGAPSRENPECKVTY